MKIYKVYVILPGADKWHEVTIECTGFILKGGAYIFYNDTWVKDKKETKEFSWYPIASTIIEEASSQPKQLKTVSGSWR